MKPHLALTAFLALPIALLNGAPANDSRPNVLVVMVDDLGFSDVGCYGGEIDTPHLDALAQNGIRFSQFYNTAKCHSSRVSLLSGQYCIAAGDTSLTHAVTSAEVLASSGYFTAMTGKWHLKQQPTDFGFQKYFGHLSGACNYFLGDGSFRLNGESWSVPKKGFYTTTANVDFGLRFLEQAREAKSPWYLYVAFNAPHAPLQALPEDYAKYRGKYQDGWDKIREARIAKQKRVGILPDTLIPSERPDHVPAWKDLTPWQRDYEANRMATLAAMIDRVDQELGRLIDDLRSHGELDNTFFLFVSDNGACPYDRKKPKLDLEPTSADESWGDSTGWAWARNSPFRYYKQNQYEGGISTPAIAHWPAGITINATENQRQSHGVVVDDPAHLIDVLPTLADITDADIPTEWPGRQLRPVSGVSIEPLFRGQHATRPQPIHLLFSADRGLRDGNWKLVSFRSAPWELYNLAEDRAERIDLARSHPERYRAMIDQWHKMAEDVLHAPNSARKAVNEHAEPHRHPEWTNFDATNPDEYVRRKSDGRSNTRSRGPRKRMRARKNTRLEISGNQLRLEFSGEDPGIAFDFRGQRLEPGPYRIHFDLKCGEQTQGEIFYTTDTKTTLPRGEKITFPIQPDGAWQSIDIEIPVNSQIYQLRIDIGDGPGHAILRDLQIPGTKD